MDDEEELIEINPAEDNDNPRYIAARVIKKPKVPDGSSDPNKADSDRQQSSG